MKKILCLIDSLGLGGAERQMVGLSVLLKKYGYNVDLVTYHIDDDYSRIAEQGGCDPVVIPVKNSPVSKFWAVYKFIKKKGGYDTIITYKSGPNAIGCLLKAFGVKSKIIVSERSFSKALNRRTKVLFFLYRFADYVVPNSYSQAEFIKKHYDNLSEKIRVITNFTDSTAFSPSCSSRLVDEPFTIMTAARITKAKNLINYLRAIQIVKEQNKCNIHFDWYGNVHKGEETYGDDVFRAVKELGIEDMISFHPATSDIANKYQSCSAFCLPSIFEGYPNVICEAMCCGKPIVCSNVCDNPYIVNEGKNALLFDPLSPSDMANQFLKISSMSSVELSQWGKNSREIAENTFSPESFIEKYKKLIES